MFSDPCVPISQFALRSANQFGGVTNFTVTPSAVRRGLCELSAGEMREPGQELLWFPHRASVNWDRRRL